MHRHPHILTIRSCFLINDTCYLVSELILGSDLETFLFGDALDDYAEELRFQAAQIVQLARWEMKNCTPLWREAHFEVKMYKTPHVRATFGGSDVEKVHAVVARSTFEVKMLQNTTCSRESQSAAFPVCKSSFLSHFVIPLTRK